MQPRRRGIGNRVGFLLGSLPRLRDFMLVICAGLGFPLHAGPRSLRHVRELVRDQPIAFLRPRRELPLAKVDLVADGERARTEISCRVRRVTVAPDLDLAERRADGALHSFARLAVERAGRAGIFGLADCAPEALRHTASV